MYRIGRNQSCRLQGVETLEGETIEHKIQRVMENNEPLKDGDGAPLIYVPRKEGVRPSDDIRTDRWEVALEASSAIDASYKARREERIVSAGEKEIVLKAEKGGLSSEK